MYRFGTEFVVSGSNDKMGENEIKHLYNDTIQPPEKIFRFGAKFVGIELVARITRGRVC